MTVPGSSERGRKLSAERRLAALDAAIERGMADVESGHVHEADAVFAEWEAKMAAPREPLK